ncbi:hypothetical protein KI387_034721, partial [Taxus chinensis]
MQGHIFPLSNGKHTASYPQVLQNKNRSSSRNRRRWSRSRIQCCKGHDEKSWMEMVQWTRIPQWADDIKEGGMRKPKSLYTHDDWVIHRSSTRHVRHLISSLSSRVILSLIPPVSILTGIAALVAVYNTAVGVWMKGFFPLPLLHASSLPFQLTAPALALLLVFRTEASYARYEEGRKTWTCLIAHVMDFARQSNAWIRHDSHLNHRLLNYLASFPLALKCHIIYGSDLRRDLATLLPENDVSFVLSSRHPPNCIIQLMSECLRQVHLNDHERNSLDSHLSEFSESIAVCERLIGTPIPLSYTRLTSRFLVLWHITLPVILWDQCEWMVVPATFISAASLFCIEEVGVLIEEPFTMLALDKICSSAHDNIREMLQIHKLIIAEEGTLFTDRLGSNSN